MNLLKKICKEVGQHLIISQEDLNWEQVDNK
jgi:hypothetical protein